MLTFGAQAQQPYPNQLVRIVVPFSAGSATDLLARAVADKLGEKWKQQVIVENRPGVAGITSVAKSAADGYTLMLNSNGHTVAGVLNKGLQFDPVKDFAGITPIASVPLVLIINPELPAKTVKEFIDLAKAKPGAMNFASPGLGIDHLHRRRPVQGRGQDRPRACALQGRAGSQHERGARRLADVFHAGQHRGRARAVRQGARARGRDRQARFRALPDVPTLKEAGLPDLLPMNPGSD